MSASGYYSPIPSKDGKDLESGTAYPYPGIGYGNAPPSAPPYQPAAPSWIPPPPPYQPVPPTYHPYQPQYYTDPRYVYGYAAPASHPSNYPVIGAYQQSGPEAFIESEIRQGFIRKVFGILSLQLLLTAIIGGTICFSPIAKQQLQAHPGLFWLAFIASVLIMLVMACNESARRHHPLNLCLLFGFTAAEGVLLGVASSQFDVDLVVLAFGLTAGITACLALFAVQTKLDFTAFGGILASAMFCMFFVSLIYIFLPYWKPAELCMSGFGALLFCAYIVYDVQLLVGGEHSVEVSPEEYIFASMNIYIDIINLFLYILRFLQAARDD